MMKWFLGMPCIFHALTGLYCPGCGGTRAVKALLAGHPVISFFYHPLVLYTVALAGWFLLSRILTFLSHGKRKPFYPDDRYAYVAAGLTLFHFIFKNALLIFCGIDLLWLLPDV